MRPGAHISWPSVGITGEAESGKDTLAALMVKELGYTRRALADSLKEMIGGLALGENPSPKTRLWVEERKHTPAMRTTLQGFGIMMREQAGSDYWVRKITEWQWEMGSRLGPVVTPDVRYLNEVTLLGNMGWVIVKVIRPGHENRLTTEQRNHVSEAELREYKGDILIVNSGTPEDMFASFTQQIMPIMLAKSGLLPAQTILK